jgi:zinc transporter ZupT
MNEQSISIPEKKPKKTLSASLAVLFFLPLLLLAGVIVIFLVSGAGIGNLNAYPVEDLTLERTVLEPGRITLNVRNSGPQAITIAQAIVNDAVWPMAVSPEGAIQRLGRASVNLDYPWVEGEAYQVILFTSNAIPFTVDIPLAVETSRPAANTLLTYTLIGLYVGVIPVFLGMFWLPALRALDRKWMTFLLAMTVGLLIFLGVDTLIEAVENVNAGNLRVPVPFQGFGIIAIGTIGTFLLLEAISRRQVATGRSEASQRLTLAFLIAVGIGIHNLGEGLAIGAAYNTGEIALGTFLVVGFILQNITEGLGIVAPVVRDHPNLKQLALMGLIGGAPAILGTWIGGYAPSATLSVFFLAIGTGAIFQVVYEIAKMLRKDTAQHPMPGMVFSGIVAGMMVLWVTGLLIK